ncbi:Protein arginine N-methyltransferase skb1 [Golovinomyces cichoracearum]|uniref:Protein arginine N-methyltransferase n=1 Tax=Golovinomyces cichoracearum TaxID=62708 RepID=A0A420I844_9PEZI|nr:Protein arginine N-methyltransferase skb1 [Golovinomyces cichoracearum]
MASSRQSPSFSDTDIENTPAMADYASTFYIGHHESGTTRLVTDTVLRQAQNAGQYDMITTPVTTAHFQNRVLALVLDYLSKFSSDNLEHSLKNTLLAPIISPLTPADTHLSPGVNVSQLIAYSSPWIDLGSKDPLISSISRQVLNIEIAYASFCGIGYIIIPGPRASSYGIHKSERLTQYARAIHEALAIGNFIHISIHVPMYDSEVDKKIIGDIALYARDPNQSQKLLKKKDCGSYDTWDTWNIVRSVCKYSPRLSVALELPKKLPDDLLQSRWFAEPLRVLCFTPSTFVNNKAGYPVLSKGHQSLITRFMRSKLPPWLLLCDIAPIPNLSDPNDLTESFTNELPSLKTEADTSKTNSLLLTEINKSEKENLNQLTETQEATAHLIYLRHLQRNQPPRTTIETFGSGYQDYLQAPLQPLADNLESVTYEVFEKDPVKYDLYEKALSLALSDWSVQHKPTSCENGSVVVAIVGSGRGPLVTRALRASKSTGVAIEIWAVEKNPNAFVFLQRSNEKEWGGVVNLVKSDMRAWKGPTRHKNTGVTSDVSVETYGHVDILVSELLGSFADNELSPECLDGVQHVLAPNYGISIPSSYTAHLTPIYAPRLHGEIYQRALSDDSAADTPYVVMLHAIDFLASSVPDHPRFQKVWEFVHPLPQQILAVSAARRGGGVSGGGGGSMCGGDGANEHNIRAAQLKFVCKDRGVVHGIAGYFEAVLYDGGSNGKVELSTRPDTIDAKSRDMISWFPIYFPLKNPLYFPDDSELEVSIWRQTDDRKVWYEWLVEAFVMTGPDIRMRLGISDMGSSRKIGCLM